MKNLFTQLDIDTSRQTGQHGFSLIETIVAMTILLVSISGIMNLIHQGSVANRQQADQIIATYLAADAIEFIRARRDSHWLENSSGNSFYDWAVNSGDAQSCQYNCEIDTRFGVSETSKIDQCGGSGYDCAPLDYNPSTGEYGYDSGPGWEESRFTRSVNIDLSSNTGSIDEAAITVTVSWQSPGAGESEVVLSQSIYDYQE